MKISAGTLILFNNKVLLCHPTNSKWVESFGPPKGGVNEGETIIDAAIRETYEETSILIDKKLLIGKNPIEVRYKNKSGKTYKKVFLFELKIDSLSEIGLESEILDEKFLQIEEIDWAGFLSKQEACPKIFKRFRDILDLI